MPTPASKTISQSVGVPKSGKTKVSPESLYKRTFAPSPKAVAQEGGEFDATSS